MKNNNWIRCPVCGNKTRDKIREDTILKNYPLYCPKYKQETLIEVTNLKMTVIAELVHRIINNCHFHLFIINKKRILRIFPYRIESRKNHV